MAEAEAAAAMPPPPYTALSSPVWSLATGGPTPTMNILTYFTPVSIDPRMCAVAVFKGSLSLRNLDAEGAAVLQLLGGRHAGLVELLGKRSGADVDKLAALEALGEPVEERYGVPTLASALAVVELEPVRTVDAGDHELVVCAVKRHERLEDEEPLTTGELRRLGVL